MAEPAFLGALAARVRAIGHWFGTPAGLAFQKWLGVLLSILVLVVLVRAIAAVGWRQVLAALPLSPLFWLLFVGSYLAQPLFNFHLYRRWWGYGWPGLGVFLKMRVMNESLFTYAGDSYLLLWATRLLGIAHDPDAPPPRVLGRGKGAGADPRTSPFAVVKDNAVTSGIAGNLATLVMLLLAIAIGGPQAFGGALDPDTQRRLLWGFAFFIALSLGIFAFRDRLMSLSAAANWRCFRIHMARVIVTHALLIGSWIVALPQVPAEAWILLGALRMVIGRFPVPNTELIFAAAAVSLAGTASIEIAALMAAQGALHLVLHAAAWATASALEAADPQARAARS